MIHILYVMYNFCVKKKKKKKKKKKNSNSYRF